MSAVPGLGGSLWRIGRLLVGRTASLLYRFRSQGAILREAWIPRCWYYNNPVGGRQGCGPCNWPVHTPRATVPHLGPYHLGAVRGSSFWTMIGYTTEGYARLYRLGGVLCCLPRVRAHTRKSAGLWKSEGFRGTAKNKRPGNTAPCSGPLPHGKKGQAPPGGKEV